MSGAVGERKDPVRSVRRKGTAVFVYTIVCLVVLSVIATTYLIDAWLHEHVKQEPMLAVGWWGAVGGLVANLEAINRTGDRWHRKMEFWYFGRPATAALFGGVGYVIYVSLVQASLSGQGSDSAQLDHPPTGLGYVLAFALGLREQTFRELLKRVFDLLAGAGGADVEPPSVPPEFQAEWSESDRGAKLSWGHSTDNVGVEGYNVYCDYEFLATVRPRRREVADASPSDEKLARADEVKEDPETLRARGRNLDSKISKVDRIVFVDQGSADQGFYSVTAVDAAGNESNPAGPMRVTVELSLRSNGSPGNRRVGEGA